MTHDQFKSFMLMWFMTVLIGTGLAYGKDLSVWLITLIMGGYMIMKTWR